MDVSRLETRLNTVSISFAIVAAVLWFGSAMVSTPDSFDITVVRPDGGILGGGGPGAKFVGSGYSESLRLLGKALKTQSALSAFAAICAGISAVAQAMVMHLRRRL